MRLVAGDGDSEAEVAAQITGTVGPPTAITIYFCPACGREVRGNYSIDEGRKKCSKLWHKASVHGYRYVREAM